MIGPFADASSRSRSEACVCAHVFRLAMAKQMYEHIELMGAAREIHRMARTYQSRIRTDKQKAARRADTTRVH